ncbi:hypothetical protein P8631_19520, partial [Guyparkeria sp. 1SP6A2]|nr:hypothetical protein [Guyparkeria sp. 1SP6A2]
AERLAEDLRLLYVALTRAVWHCSLGIAPLTARRSDKPTDTELHHSAPGRLLQKGEVLTAAGLETCLRALCDEHIALTLVTPPDNTRW